MKKLLRLSILSLLTYGMMTNSSGWAEDYPNIEPSLEMFGGFSLIDASSDPRASFASDYYVPSTSYPASNTRHLRSGTRKAIEYQSEDNSLLVGGSVEAFPFPQRFYLDVNIEGDDSWLGEVRHAYKDLFQMRVLSRRFVHNLDNLTIYDPNPTASSNDVSRLDIGTEYGETIDIDQFKLRLKTPNFPFHLYTEGEMVRRNGNRQQLFWGNTAGVSTRVSKAMDVDQETKEVTLGANSHLRWLEADISHSWQTFDSDVNDLAHYNLYTPTAGDAADGIPSRAAGDYLHNKLPELKSNKNTLKVHTTQTGQVFASATLMDIDRKNETSDLYEIEAKRRLAYSDLMWTPRGNLSLGTKYRHRENSGSAPETIASPYNGASRPIDSPVGGDTNAYTAFVRYAPISKLTLKGQYIIERMERDQAAAITYSLAEQKDTDTLEMGAAWRARRDLKVNAKYIYKDVDVDKGEVANIFNMDPEKSNQYSADVTYFPTAQTTILASAFFKQDKASNLQTLKEATVGGIDGLYPPITKDTMDYDAAWQRYLLSATHACTSRFSVTGSYAYSILDTDRDFATSRTLTTLAAPTFDAGYNNKQTYHNFALSSSFQATDKLDFEALLDYTIANADYNLTQANYNNLGLPLGDLSMVDSKQLGLRLASDYKLGQGWKAGVILRYVNLIDKSFDNPADADMYGALLKFTKVFK